MSLRAAVIALAALGLAAGLVALATGAFSPALVFGGWAVMILLGTVCEKVRYKPLLAGAPGPEWQRTPECFRDPESGELVRVFVNRAGERLYVRD